MSGRAGSGEARTRRRVRRRAPLYGQVGTWARRVRQEVWPREPQPSPRWRPCWPTIRVQHLLPLALYAAITVVATFPLILHFGTRIPSDGGDALMNYWGFWWAREAATTGRNPFFTPYLYAPYGAPLYLHTLNLFNGLASIPFQAFFGLTSAYNAVVFLSFILAAYFAYLLVAHFCGSRLAGFAGGVVYAFGAYHLTHLLGHTNLLSSEWLPAYLLCLVRACESAGRRRTGYVVAAIGALTLLMLCDWFYVIVALLLTGLVSCWWAMTRRCLAPLLVAVAIGVVWGFLALPLVLATAAEIRSGVTDRPDISVMRIYSADPLAFVLPSTRLWIFNWLGIQVKRPFEVPPVEGDIFLGYVPLLLGACGVWLARRRARPWLLVAVVFLLLSLGPYLHINGTWRVGPEARTLPLPYMLLHDLPAFSVMRTPVRLALGVTLALAVLTGLGLTGLTRRWPRLGAGRARVALLAAVVVALLAEQLTVPFPLEATSAPDFYRELAASPEQGAILELPISYKRSLSDYYQTVHGRPIIAGYLARRLDYPIRKIIPSPNLPPPGDDIFPRPATQNLGYWALAWCNVHWIVIYRDDPGFDEGVTEFVARYADGGPIYDDGRMAVYRPLPPSGTALGLAIGPGWYEQERLADGHTNIRWFGSAATVHTWQFGAASERFALRFDAWSFHEPRRLEVRVDGRSLGQWRVTETQHFDIPLSLTSGQHAIELRALDPPVSPVSVGLAGKDTRPLAFAISNLVLDK